MKNNVNQSLEHISVDHSDEGIDRKGVLKSIAWAGTDLSGTVGTGLFSSPAFGDSSSVTAGTLSYMRFGESHTGFNKAVKTDVAASLQAAVDKINALPTPPAFVLFTGDLTQIAQVDQFDTVEQILKGAKTQSGAVFYVPCEHDVMGYGGTRFLARDGKNTKRKENYSFDIDRTHYIGVVNAVGLDTGPLGELGPDQLAWLQNDIRYLQSNTSIVVFAHVAL